MTFEGPRYARLTGTPGVKSAFATEAIPRSLCPMLKLARSRFAFFVLTSPKTCSIDHDRREIQITPSTNHPNLGNSPTPKQVRQFFYINPKP